MMDFLYNIDLQVFYFLNHTIANSFFDKFFPFITEVKHWYLTYIILWLILFFKGGRLGKIAALMILVVITVSDQFSSHFLKEIIGRIRPCNALPDARILVGCTQSFSFPSSHAVNNFAIAFFLYRLFPKYKWVLFATAFIVALSRPIVGVHYPSDMAGGAIIGGTIGYLFSFLAFYINKKIEMRKDFSESKIYQRIKDLK